MKKTAVRKDILGGGVILIIFLTVFSCVDDIGNTPGTTHDHQWGDWVQLSAATCDEAEKLIRTCLLDPTQSETVLGAEALGHDWDEETTIPATETENGKKVTICKNDTEHIIESDEFSGEYATGTAGLQFDLIASGNDANTYRVSRGTFTGSTVHIPAYSRPLNSTSYDDYKLVTQVNNGTTNSLISNAFGGTVSVKNTAITAVTFTEDSRLTTISNNAFSYSPNLTDITLPESVTSIGEGAFFGCSGLTSITIPEGVKTISSTMFRECKNLISITIPEDAELASLGGIFYDCNKLESITIPASTTTIGAQTFWSCFALTSITIPEGVTVIGNQAFQYCNNLVSVTLPEGLTAIGSSAFGGCTNLTSVTLPTTVTNIAGAFQNSGLTSITFKGNSVPNFSATNTSMVPNGSQFRTLYNAQTVKAGTYTRNSAGTWEKTSEL